MVEQEQEPINIDELKKFNDNLKKYNMVIVLLLLIFSGIMIGYFIKNVEYVKKNACQVCESYGRHCYEINESMYNVKLPNMVRIKPFA